jgi:hypothetical protein
VDGGCTNGPVRWPKELKGEKGESASRMDVSLWHCEHRRLRWAVWRLTGTQEQSKERSSGRTTPTRELNGNVLVRSVSS